MAEKEDRPDIFLLEKLFPEADQMFSFEIPPLQSVQEKCDVVLDTNVLLFPYRTESKSLIGIRTVYQKLKEKGRLFIPARVVREFVRNKASRLLDVTKALADKRSKDVTPLSISYPLLNDLDEYKAVLKTKEELDKSFKTYQEALGKLLEATSSLGWNDPVSKMYRELFSPEIINELTTKNEEIEKALEFRIRNKIPPGYKDASKDDRGVGDLVIWMTILQIAKTRRNPLLFVTGEEKDDWYNRVNNRGALPRYELIDEFRRESGCAFYIASFSDFLKLFKAPSEVISEVQKQETTDNLTAVVRTSAMINVRLIESLNLLMEMAKNDPRNAIRRSWELLATTIFGATNVKTETLHPDSEAMSTALKRLESSVEFSTELVGSIKALRDTARKVFNHSEWAYSPFAKEAEEFVLYSAASRRDLGENVQ